MTSSESSETIGDSSPPPAHEGEWVGEETTRTERNRRLDTMDVESRYEGGAADYGLALPTRSISRPDQVVISWEPNDPENPYNWPSSKKMMVISFTAVLVINSTLGSSLPSMAIPNIQEAFSVVSKEQEVLPISTYLIGYVFGPLIWGPLSEHYGRRDLTLVTFSIFSIFTMACALAPSWPALLVFRLFCGVFASSPIAIVAGILADIYDDPVTRGRAYAIFMACTTWGPLFSPIISGFVAPTIGWRWIFWIALILAGITFAIIIFLPETFGPILLARRAKKLRQEQIQNNVTDANIFAPRDLEVVDLAQLLTVVLTRPVRMLIYEPIVSSTCAYLAFLYTLFYMCFQAFPIIFQSLYGLSPGVTGLAYLPVGVGATLSLPVFWLWDNILQRAIVNNAAWTKREEYRRLPLAIFGGPLFVVSLFWLGFTSRNSISFVVPMLAGIPFGMGYMLIFMAMLNYLTDAYEIFAASANAATSTCRSLLAVILPFATTPMFQNLGISGACALLGGLSAMLCLIPLVFIWKGTSLRNHSKFCIALRERKEEILRKAEEDRQRRERAMARKIQAD